MCAGNVAEIFFSIMAGPAVELLVAFIAIALYFRLLHLWLIFDDCALGMAASDACVDKHHHVPLLLDGGVRGLSALHACDSFAPEDMACFAHSKRLVARQATHPKDDTIRIL